MRTTTCGRCRHPLRSAESIACGYGPDCLNTEITERLADFPAWQADKAREAFELGAVVPTTRRELYIVVSSDGAQRYLVDASWNACICKAAEHGRRCYHVAAALLASVAAPIAAAA